ncbi:MAG: YtxH protein [Microbacteriaceae bacterium]|nr:YtxH protein [Microbacteriaceae bacterium]
MRGRVLLVVGLAVGYVLGTRAGREKYDQMVAQAQKLWNDPRVQKQVKTAEQFAKDKAPDVVDFVTDNAKKVAAQVGSRSTASKSSTTKPVTKPRTAAPKTSTAK